MDTLKAERTTGSPDEPGAGPGKTGNSNLNNSNYECPVCMDYMLPPIYQCYNGHPICNQCELKIAVCPVCRDDLPKTKRIRSLVLEGIVVGLTFDCKNMEQGCQTTMKYHEIEDHNWDCQFSKLPICSHLGYKCDAKKTSQEILSHLKSSMHSILGINFGDVTSDKESDCGSSPIEVCQSVSMTRLERGDRPTWTPHYFQFHGHLFFLMSNYDPVGKAIVWTVAILGSGKLAKQFLARIKLLPQKSGIKFLEWQDEVAELKNAIHKPNVDNNGIESSTSNPSKSINMLRFNISIQNLRQLCESQQDALRRKSSDASAWSNTAAKKDAGSFLADEEILNWRLQLRFAQRKPDSDEMDSEFEWKEKMAGVVMDSVITYGRQSSAAGSLNIPFGGATGTGTAAGSSIPTSFGFSSHEHNLVSARPLRSTSLTPDTDTVAHLLNLMRQQNITRAPPLGSPTSERPRAAVTTAQDNLAVYMRQRQRQERRRREQGQGSNEPKS